MSSYLVPKDEYTIFYNSKIASENGDKESVKDNQPTPSKQLTHTPLATGPSSATDLWTGINIGSNAFSAVKRPAPLITTQKTASFLQASQQSPLTTQGVKGILNNSLGKSPVTSNSVEINKLRP